MSYRIDPLLEFSCHRQKWPHPHTLVILSTKAYLRTQSPGVGCLGRAWPAARWLSVLRQLGAVCSSYTHIPRDGQQELPRRWIWARISVSTARGIGDNTGRVVLLKLSRIDQFLSFLVFHISRTFGSVTLGAIMNKGAMNVHLQGFVVICFPFFWVNIWVLIKGYMISVYFTL